MSSRELSPKLGVRGVEQWWFQFVAGAVRGYLDELARRASASEDPLGGEIGKLVAAWRTLLAMHAAEPDGRCAICTRRGGNKSAGPCRLRLGRRQRKELCTVWQVAIGYFLRRPPR